MPNWLVTATKTFKKEIWGLCRHSSSPYTQTPSRGGKVALHQLKNGIISRVWRAYEDDADFEGQTVPRLGFCGPLPGRWSPQQHLSLSPSHGPSCKWSRKWPITRRAGLLYVIYSSAIWLLGRSDQQSCFEANLLLFTFRAVDSMFHVCLCVN